MTDLEPSIELVNLSRTYGGPRGGHVALRGVNYCVPDRPGHAMVVALVGPSGCGKSTLLRLVAGLDQPTEGMVCVGGKHVVGPGPNRAMVFQAYNALPWRTVLDNAALGLEFAGTPRAEREATCMELLQEVGLQHHALRFPSQLSGGQRQRLALVRALAGRPRVLLADEPFGALDVRARRDAQDLLLRISREAGSTVILVTHDLGEAVQMADEVVVMAPSPGRIAHIVAVDLPRPRAPADDDHNVREIAAFLGRSLREVTPVEAPR